MPPNFWSCSLIQEVENHLIDKDLLNADHIQMYTPPQKMMAISLNACQVLIITLLFCYIFMLRSD